MKPYEHKPIENIKVFKKIQLRDNEYLEGIKQQIINK